MGVRSRDSDGYNSSALSEQRSSAIHSKEGESAKKTETVPDEIAEVELE